ncbi:MAG: tetratricopeptide repeat protein [Bryobacteraceae bacterium]
MAWNVNPSRDEIELLMESGYVYRDARRFAEARDVFRGVRALLPASEVAEVALGTVCFEQGDFRGAAKHYRRAIEMNPNSALAHAHMGELRLFEKDKDGARECLKKAVEVDPRGPVRPLVESLREMVDVVRFQA